MAEWCGDGYPAALSDRIWLLQVRREVEHAMLPDVQAELPMLAGAPSALFHNRAPVVKVMPTCR